MATFLHHTVMYACVTFLRKRRNEEVPKGTLVQMVLILLLCLEFENVYLRSVKILIHLEDQLHIVLENFAFLTANVSGSRIY